MYNVWMGQMKTLTLYVTSQAWTTSTQLLPFWLESKSSLENWRRRLEVSQVVDEDDAALDELV